MIGNDIVDLKQAAINSPDSYRDGKRYQRFLDKIFTAKEQELILASENQHQTVWLLWSMKEAAFKVNVQQFGKRFFNPKRLECELISVEKGMVSINGESYFTTTEITVDYIYTIATLNDSVNYSSVYSTVDYCSYFKQSDFLKKAFLKAFSQAEKIPLDTLKIIKTEVGVPYLYSNSERLLTFLSMTHCGRYSGFAYI